MIGLKNRGYGCFTATLRCDECNKINLTKEFSWDRDHIGMGEKEKINGVMLLESEKREINYCVKCGKSLRKGENSWTHKEK